jgi:hypothetical protein
MTTKHLHTQGAKLPDVEDIDIAHLAGFLDGTGKITAHVSKNKKYSIGYEIQPLVKFIRPSSEDPALGKLMEYCDENGVRYGVSERSQAPDREHRKSELIIKRPDSIMRFLEPMLPYLTSQYPKAIVMLEQIVPRIEDEVHHEKEGFYELMEFADMIREGGRGGKLKYTQEYFADEWSVVQ